MTKDLKIKIDGNIQRPTISDNILFFYKIPKADKLGLDAGFSYDDLTKFNLVDYFVTDVEGGLMPDVTYEIKSDIDEEDFLSDFKKMAQEKIAIFKEKRLFNRDFEWNF